MVKSLLGSILFWLVCGSLRLMVNFPIRPCSKFVLFSWTFSLPCVHQTTRTSNPSLGVLRPHLISDGIQHLLDEACFSSLFWQQYIFMIRKQIYNGFHYWCKKKKKWVKWWKLVWPSHQKWPICNNTNRVKCTYLEHISQSKWKHLFFLKVSKAF